MLVISRLNGETVLIRHSSGEVIEVKVIEIDRKKIRLGFKGKPSSFSVIRSEIAEYDADGNLLPLGASDRTKPDQVYSDLKDTLSQHQPGESDGEKK